MKINIKKRTYFDKIIEQGKGIRFFELVTSGYTHEKAAIICKLPYDNDLFKTIINHYIIEYYSNHDVKKPDELKTRKKESYKDLYKEVETEYYTIIKSSKLNEKTTNKTVKRIQKR